ncbi:probable DNA-directed RNA polymerases I and III subunit RPAC2 isoform X2 [Trichogramma pretiosum]|uniref:DNA-directed RNA polymerase RBP11-like dimerisation domain-containing protein n=1 Tax=Trichogramma kaykai TaxID=54128 RepID=A0ABD2WS18_9HYME|nr:probable DNA-directed RNA polymerases I and III subunit RPAC2 isoform X2 [Trichogramma pretiosum]
MGRAVEQAGETDDDENAKTFVFEDEGHTFGNVLKSIISDDPDVEFCGYIVPQTTNSKKMYFRIKAKNGKPEDILRKGLASLCKVCEMANQTLENSMERYRSSHS